MEPIEVPEMGKVEEVDLVQWKYEEGDRVEAGSEIAEVETMKTAFAVLAPAAGVLEEIAVGAGEKAKVGQKIGSIRRE